MIRITNLTNSPFDLVGAEGGIRLPAFGWVEVEEGQIDGAYLDVLRASAAVAVGPVSIAKAPAEAPVRKGRR